MGFLRSLLHLINKLAVDKDRCWWMLRIVYSKMLPCTVSNHFTAALSSSQFICFLGDRCSSDHIEWYFKKIIFGDDVIEDYSISELKVYVNELF
jgi:hypothetical protein